MPIFRGPWARDGDAARARPPVPRAADLFTVDPYAPEMARATDDRPEPDGVPHFLLGTDRDELYRLDDLILRRVVSRDDEATVAALARAEAERWASAAAVDGEIDVAATVAKYVPLRIVGDYLGVPLQEMVSRPRCRACAAGIASRSMTTRAALLVHQDREGAGADRRGSVRLDQGRLPQHLQQLNPAGPLLDDFRERGVVANEYLTAYVHALLGAARQRMDRGEAVPDTMLTRLLRLQADSRGGRRWSASCPRSSTPRCPTGSSPGACPTR